jgi:transcriptional regulator of acetoin/glycerol metabolism
LAGGSVIEARDLPSQFREAPANPARALTRIEEAERRAIIQALESTRGHKSNAARLLGIGKTTLYSKLKEYEIEAAP